MGFFNDAWDFVSDAAENPLGFASQPYYAASIIGADKAKDQLFPKPQEGGDTPGENQADISRGMQEGRDRASEIYGQDYATTGSNVQDIIQRRRAAMKGSDPASTEMREGRNREIAMARARGANEGQVAQISRDAESRIDRQRFERQDKTLTDYQKLIGNVLGGSTGLEMGFGSLRGAGTANPPPQSSGGFLGSVICTQLYWRGYMSADIYIKDTAYGIRLREQDPAVYQGYLVWAPTVVKWMRKSPLLTSIIAVPAMAWARNMAGEKNLFGELIARVGEPICRFIGRNHGRISVQEAQAQDQEHQDQRLRSEG